jgi:hypothetical protein
MPPHAPHPGLCAACVYAQRIVTERGSEFWLCRRGLTGLAFPKYPRLPVMLCGGFEEADRPPERKRAKDAVPEVESEE